MKKSSAAVLCGLLSMATAPAPARAEESPNDEVLWQRALVLLARQDPDAQAVLASACEAGSARACLRAAATALEGDDLETADDLLRMARDGAPDDVQIRLELARVMAARGNFMWATRELQALDQQGHDVDFELGYCLYQLEMHERAAERLSRAAAGDEGPGMAALYAASALEALGQQEEALRLARRAASDEVDPAVAEAGTRLVAALGGSGGGERTLISASGTVGSGYDSNPVLGPDDAPTNAGGARLWLRAVVFGEPLGSSSWALGARVAASRDQSFDATVRPFDFTSVQAQGHGRLLFGSQIRQELRVGYRFSIGLLDGGAGVEENGLYVYNESHFADLVYSIQLGETVITRVRARSGFSGYHNRARSGVPLDVALGQSLTLVGGRLKLYLEAGARAAWTRSPQYNRVGPAVSVAAAYLTPLWDLELLASWSWSWSHYRDSTGVDYGFDYARPDLRRLDSIHSLAIELARSFLDGHLRVGLRYRMTDSTSSITTYDYSRSIGEVAVTGGF